MARVSIEIFEFSLLIHHNDGITVIFPQPEHELSIVKGGTTIPVPRGTDLELYDAGGDQLPPARTRTTEDYERLVVDLAAASGKTIDVPHSLIDRTVTPEGINGRLFLRGGTITAMECTDARFRVPFAFDGGKETFFLTDTAVFSVEIAGGLLKGMDVAIADGEEITIQNHDAPGSTKPFADLSDFVALCSVVGQSIRPPRMLGSPVQSMGGRTVCPHVRVSI
jgi:hypothetical protein